MLICFKLRVAFNNCTKFTAGSHFNGHSCLSGVGSFSSPAYLSATREAFSKRESRLSRAALTSASDFETLYFNFVVELYSIMKLTISARAIPPIYTHLSYFSGRVSVAGSEGIKAHIISSTIIDEIIIETNSIKSLNAMLFVSLFQFI